MAKTWDDKRNEDDDEDIFLVQIVAAPWSGNDGKLTSTLYALDDEGRMFKYSAKDDVLVEIGKRKRTQQTPYGRRPAPTQRAPKATEEDTPF